MDLTCAERLHDLDEMRAFEDAYMLKIYSGEYEEASAMTGGDDDDDDDWELVTDEEMQRLELLYADEPSLKNLRAKEDAHIVKMLWNSLGTNDAAKIDFALPSDEEWDIVDGSEID